MATRFALLLISLLVLGFAVAGCGDDDDSSSSESSSGGDTSSQESAKEEDSGGDGNAAPGLGSDAAKRAAERCKTTIDAESLSGEIKADLEEICQEAADGDEDAVRNATREVCEKIILDKVPEGPARDTALKSCDQATATP